MRLARHWQRGRKGDPARGLTQASLWSLPGKRWESPLSWHSWRFPLQKQVANGASRAGKKKPSVKRVKISALGPTLAVQSQGCFSIRMHWSITFKSLRCREQKTPLTPRGQLTHEATACMPPFQHLFALKISCLFLVGILGSPFNYLIAVLS